MQRSTELTDVMRRWYDDVGRGDLTTFDRLFARRDDVLLIGTDPREWWTGGEQAIEIFRTQVQEMGGSFTMVSKELQAFEEGSVGWIADRPEVQLPGDLVIPLRLTAVFHRETGGWRCVQWHASIGQANEEALGQELTIERR